MNRSDDLITVLIEDHEELRQLFTELEMLSGGESLRRMLADHVIIEMVRHAVAEETYLDPALLANLSEGGWIVDEMHVDHERLEDILQQLEVRGVPDEEFSLLVGWLITSARRHMRDEEDRVFPLLVQNTSRAELVSLGERATHAKTMAASGASPEPDGKPVLLTLLESGAGLVERVRAHLCGHERPYPSRGR